MRIAALVSAGMIAAAAPMFARAEPVRDAAMSLMGARLFPVLEDMGANRMAPVAPGVIRARRERIAACGAPGRCWFEAALWREPEIAAMSAAARAGLTSREADWDDGAPAQLERELRGINSIMSVYALGGRTTYPSIDGPDDPTGQRSLEAARLAGAAADDPGILDPSVALCLALLDVNNRYEAVAIDPLAASLNAAGLDRARRVAWKSFPYTALIVLGAGPEDLVTTLSGRSKFRLRHAAERFAAGDAPFIIVSGGAVHPRGTTRVEAIEMRRALIERFGVPEDAIIVEPYARHTTTNLRNASRLLAALKAPSSRSALVITDPEHSASISAAEFGERNLRELGYLPGDIGRRLSAEALEFSPSRKSSRIDPADPLDP